MNSKVILICLWALAACSFLKSSKAAAGGDEGGRDPAAKRLLLIPFANPLKGFEANTMAWHTSTKLFTSWGDYLAKRTGLEGSTVGRLGRLVLDGYFTYATKYYSHEMAHEFHQKTDNQHLWVDMTDWSHLVPEFVSGHWLDFWGDDWRKNNLRDIQNDPKIISWLILVSESGLYQGKCNARYVAKASAGERRTTITSALSFVINHQGDFTYNLFRGKEPFGLIYKSGYVFYDSNDVTSYIWEMGMLDIVISRDDWLISAALAFFASGQTWNSARALYRYLVDGEEGVDNLTFDPGGGLTVSPPNFYLFSSVRGLYLDTEFFLTGLRGGRGGLYLDFGTGLDSFGLNQTGPVDWIRIGGEYRALDIAVPVIGAELSPFCYLNFNRSFRHRGQSLGASLRVRITGKFSLSARMEHNREDMIEQVIKNEAEGFNLLAALEITL